MGDARKVEVVLFASSFRLPGTRGGVESPNILHALRPDRSRTLCGRVGWVTEEGTEDEISVCCLRCMAALKAQVTP